MIRKLFVIFVCMLSCVVGAHTTLNMRKLSSTLVRGSKTRARDSQQPQNDEAVITSDGYLDFQSQEKKASVSNEDGKRKGQMENRGRGAKHYAMLETATDPNTEQTVIDLPDSVKKTGKWGYLAISATTAALIVLFLVKLGDCLGSPRLCATPEERLEADLALARNKAKALEQALKDRQIEEAKKRGEEPPHDEDDEQKNPELEESLSREELLGAVLYDQREADKQAAEGLNDARQQMNLVVKRAELAQNVLSDEATESRRRAEAFAREEAKALFLKLGAAMGEDSSDLLAHMEVAEKRGSIIPSEAKKRQTIDMAGASLILPETDESRIEKKFRKELEPPPTALLVAGMFAPGALRSIKRSADTTILFDGVFAAMGIGIWLLDRQRPCGNKRVWIWLEGLIICNCLTVLCSAVLRSRAYVAVLRVDAYAGALPKTLKTGNKILDLFKEVQIKVPVFFKNIKTYDSVVNSWAQTVSKLAVLLRTIWNGYGCYVALKDAVINQKDCEARSALFFLHIFAFWFIFTLVFQVLGLVLWIVNSLATSSVISSTLFAIARSIDDAFPGEIPIAMTLVRAFFLRDTPDVLAVSKGLNAAEIKGLEKQIDVLQKELDKQVALLESNKYYLEAAEKQEQDLIEKYLAKKESFEAEREAGNNKGDNEAQGSDAAVA